MSDSDKIRGFRRIAEDQARQRGIPVEQYLEQLDREPDPNTRENEIRENEILETLERGLDD